MHTEYAERGGQFPHICEFWKCLYSQVSARGYFPETNKYILATETHILRCSKKYFSSLKFNVLSANLYLTSYLLEIRGNRPRDRRI